MALKEILLIISLTGFFGLGISIFYFLHNYKVNRKPKEIIIAILIPILIILIYPIYTSISTSIYNKKYNTFSIKVESNLNDLDFQDLHYQIEKKSNAEEQLLIARGHSDMKIFIDKDANIIELSLKVIVPKYDKYFLYTSYYEDGRLFFVPSFAVSKTNFTNINLLESYLNRLASLDEDLLNTYLSASTFNYGMGLDINYYNNDQVNKIPLTTDPYFNRTTIAIDGNNVVYENQVIEVGGKNITIELSYLPKEIDQNTAKHYNSIIIFDKIYYYRNQHKIVLFNFE